MSCGNDQEGWFVSHYGERSQALKKHDVYCRSCNFTAHRFKTIVEAASAWNRRVPTPTPQWTAEPPKEEGWYMYFKEFYICGLRQETLNAVYVKDCVKISSTYITLQQARERSEKSDYLLWLKLELPPLPESERKESEE